MKTLQVNLQVQADIAAAQRNLQSLAKTLNEIGNKPLSVDSGPLKEAQEAAQQLQIHLQNAVNVNTGKLNLNALNSSLKQSGTNLNQLAMNLQSAGTKGQQAFLKLAQAVSSAEVPMYQMNSHLKKFGVTLLNTIKWQIASNLIHGVQGALQGVVNHAKELNQALTDIQIVTGYGSNQMAELADSARRAAKELNSTTVEYSKAALIFYQQGLNGDAVQERTSTVIKLAQVTHQTAEQVSSQMTAIWNNFDDGSHKLEYYADVITKLGAATASSSAEISEGLQKFAAVADTVGLSYEKAAASLATVVAETRQSPEVVGTAFKTMLARIEGLNLGETLEDGVSLNKYSEALQKVGVNVLNAKGELLDMDSILNKLGKQWNLLGDSTKVALAQTVAGVRQYSQFIALMDNYDKVLSNQRIAENSSGTLQKQADIWSKSWSAAAKRVEQIKTELYDEIFQDDTLIKLEDTFGGILNGIKSVMDAAGGFIPLITMIIGRLSGTLFPMVLNGMRRMQNHIDILSGGAKKSMEETQNAFHSMLENMLSKENGFSETTKQQISLTLQLSKAKQDLANMSKNMSETQKQEAMAQMQVYEAQVSNIQKILEEKAALEENIKIIKQKIEVEHGRQIAATAGINAYEKEHGEVSDEIKQKAASTRMGYTKGKMDAVQKKIKEDQDKQNIFQNTSQEIKEDAKQIDDLKKQRGIFSTVDQTDQESKKQEIANLDERINKAEEYNKLLREQKDIKKRLEDNQKELIDLQKILDIQKEINKAKQGVTSAVVGKTEGFDSQKSLSDNPDQMSPSEQMTDSMRKSIAANLGGLNDKGEVTENMGGMVLDTSIDNLEKLCETLVKYDNLLKQSKDSQENLQKSQEKVKNTEKELNKIQKEKQELANKINNSTGKTKKDLADKKKLNQLEQEEANLIKKSAQAIKERDNILEKTKQSLLDLAKKAGLSDDEIKKMSQDLKNIKTPDKLNEFFNQFDTSLKNTETGVNELLTNMKNDLNSIGVPPEIFENFIKDLIKSGYLTEELAVKLKLIKAPEPPTDKWQLFSKKMGAVTSSMSSAAMAMTSLKTIQHNLFTDEDVSLYDRVTSILMSMSMLIPSLTGKYGVFNTVKKISNKLSQLELGQYIKNIAAAAKEGFAIEGNTFARLKNAASTVAQKIAENGWAGIALGIALAATIATTTAIIANTTAREKNTAEITKADKVNKESAKNIQEAAKSWEEQTNTIDTLIKKYKDLSAAGKDVSEAQKNILDQAPDLIASYKDLDKTLKNIDLSGNISELEHAVTAGDIKKIEKIRDEIDQKVAKESTKQMKKGAEAQAKELANKINDTDSGDGIDDGKLKIDIDGNDHDNSGEEQAAAKYLTKALGDIGIDYSETGKYTKDIDFSLDISDPDKFVKQYEALLTAKQEMEENMDADELDDSGVYEEVENIINETKESYEELKSLVEDMNKYSIENEAIDLNVTKATNYQEYTQKISELENNMKEKILAENKDLTDAEVEKQAKQMVKIWAEGKDILSDYVQISNKLSYIEENYGSEVKEEIEEAYKNIEQTDPEKAKLFAQIDFSKVASDKALEEELNRLQNKANQEKITTKIKLITEASNALKNGGMSEDDWKKIQDLEWKDIEKDTGVNYLDFLNMNYDAQKKFLQDIQWQSQYALPETISEGIQQNEETIERLESETGLKNFDENKYNKLIQSAGEFAKSQNLKDEKGNDLNDDQALDYLLQYYEDHKNDEKQENEVLFNKAEEIFNTHNDLTQGKNIDEAVIKQLADTKIALEENQAKLITSIRDTITSASSLSDLDNIMQNYIDKDVDMEEYYSSYSTALINLGNSYENCTEEVLKYQQALASGSAELLAETEATLRNAISIGEQAKALGLENKALEEQAKELISVNKLSKENYNVATKVAVLNQSMNKGLKDLVDNWDDYKKTLQSAQKGTQDYAETALKVKTTLAQLLGVLSEDYIPDDFLEIPGVMDLIDKAVQGDIKSINQLGYTMAKTTIEAMKWYDGMNEGDDLGLYILEKDFKSAQEEVLEGVNSLIDAIENGTIKAGEDITQLMDGTGKSWIDSLNLMAKATNMSVDEMRSLLNELGVEAEVQTEDKTMETEVPEYTTYEKTYEDNSQLDENTATLGEGYKKIKSTTTVQTGTKKVTGKVPVAQINMGEENKGKKPVIKYAGRDNPSQSALTKSDSSDKSSSSSKNTSAASHTHEVHRYSNEKNMVEGLKQQYEKLNQAKDKAFGANRIQMMDLELKKLKELKQASSNYLDAIVGSGNAKKVAEALYKGENLGSMISGGQLGGTIKADYNSLYRGLSASGKQVEYTAKDNSGNQWLASANYNLNDFNRMFGTNLSFSLDSFGNIQNKDAILNLLNNLSNQEASAYSKIADPSASSTTEYNLRTAYLKEIKERLEQYGTTLNDLSSQSDQYLEYIAQIQDKNVEIISEKLNNGIALSNNTLTRLERAIKVLGNDIYKSAEKMTKWFDIKSKENNAEYEKQHELNQKTYDDIMKGVELYQKNPFDENAITPEKAAEMLQTLEENENSLYEKIVQDIADIGEATNNTLSEWKNNIEKVTSSIDFNIEKLSHLQKVFELLGKSADYDSLNSILQEQAESALIDYRQAQDTANKAKEVYLKAHEDLLSKQEGTEDYEFFYNNTYIPLLQTYQEYEKNAEAKLETAIEKQSAVHENMINKIYQMYEQELSGRYGSFDNLDKSMGREQSMADEYLTKTNQIYETNKLLRNLQQDIDKTDSNIAKKKLNSLAEEFTALQKREKLTKNDLELAKSKYELLKAQIALEEAQNAKSTVRLRRDNNGNYGYVYTANEDKTSNAQQNLEDKQNSYYNLLLEQYNNYIAKDISLSKEYQEEKKALDQAFYVDGTINEDQYLLGLEELNNFYKEKEILYQEKINERGNLLDENATELRKEAWTNMYEDIATEQSLFNDTATGSAQKLNKNLQFEMNDWNSYRKQILKETEMDNEHLKTSVKSVTKEIESLGSQITKKGGLADQFKTAASATENLTSSFKTQYERLLNNQTAFANLANTINSTTSRMRELTSAQNAYNQAVANQSRANYGIGSAGTYGAVGNGLAAGLSAGATNKFADNNKCPPHNYEYKGYQDKTETYLSDAGPGFSTFYAVRNYKLYTFECSKCHHQKVIKGPYGWEGGIPQIDFDNTNGNLSTKAKNNGFRVISGKTGMYTGSWNGPDIEENGKLAFLHQKELVLNADDTENMLSAVKLIRQISQTIDLQAAAYNAAASGLSIGQLANNNQTLQQEVTIHAEFPNATDHNEIEEAFNNLVNRASQYANRY